VEYDDGLRELYDLSVDPYELNNLAATVDPDFMTQLSEWLVMVKNCGGVECHAAEDALLPAEVVSVLGKNANGN
jgi:hypothetical protein